MSLLEETVAKIEKQDMDSREHAKEHILNLTMPPWGVCWTLPWILPE